MRLKYPSFYSAALLCAAVPALVAGCGPTAHNGDEGETAAATDSLTDDTVQSDDSTEITVVELPAVTETTSSSSSDSSALTYATEIARVIATDPSVERVRHDNGWAWVKDGKVLRSASADGKQVSYFRNGDETPFLTQKGDATYAVNKGTPTRSYDRNGRAHDITSDESRTAKQLVSEARKDGEEARERIEQGQPGSTSRQQSTTQREEAAKPTATSTPATKRSEQTRQQDRPTQTRPGATPTPTASASPRDRDDQPPR